MRVSSVGSVDLERLIVGICDEYVGRWKTEGRRYINVQSFEQMYAEGNLTPIEFESTLVVKLGILNKENPAIPPAIPLLPLPILRKLAIHLTRTLEIQVNQDHYEFWAWSAEVFRSFENNLPILKTLKDGNAIELLYLLFHICLAKLRYTPLTREAEVLNRVIDTVVNRHVQHVISNKFVIGIPIAASAFEALLKTFINLYGPEEARRELAELEKNRRATLGKTLGIFEERVLPHTSQEFQTGVQELNKIIESIWSTYGKTWREILLNWRNRFMHGAETWAPRAFAVYTNYICLILWHTIPQDEYESKRRELLKAVEQRIHSYGAEDFWSFYPP